MDPILNRFGYDEFREGQQEVITALEEGHDAIAILPTGNGKSFIYQYIGVKEKCRVVIVSPLIALMVDQVASLKQLGIHRAVAITSLMSESEKNYILSTLNEFQFIFVLQRCYKRLDSLSNYQNWKLVYSSSMRRIVFHSGGMTLEAITYLLVR